MNCLLTSTNAIKKIRIEVLGGSWRTLLHMRQWTLRAQSPDGNTFLCEMKLWPTF